MSEKKHIMLDFDGTIADTSEGIVRSMHYVYDRIGLERENEETIRSTIGPPLEQMLAILLKTDDKEYIKKCVVLFRERYAEKGIEELCLYDGVKETLQELSESGKKLYIVTSKPEEFVIEICRKQGIYGYFTAFTGVSKIKISPSKSERMAILMNAYGITSDNGVMVGDCPPDAVAAAANNVECIGALYGFGKKSQLMEKGCEKFINRFSELKSLLS